MEPWYKVATPRREVREGRSFNPDEFAIALEQVVAGTAPEDYRLPEQFFARTCFTRALKEHVGLVLRRLAGRTDNTAPVLTLITQFGGGKTHTLTSLYHLANNGPGASAFNGVSDLISEAGIESVPKAKVAVFVGNAWDPQPGRETPWIDVARQLAGDAGIAALGSSAKTTPPGTESISRVFQAAGAPVLLLFDEVLNYLNRHRAGAESFHAFIQNLTVATTGTTHGACVISLPRSQVEMTQWDQEWQDKISKVVRRVAKDLIANDEAEISEVVRRRLFQDLGSEKTRRNVAKAFGDWCFERRAQLPPEWTAVDSAATEAKAREQLQRRFEACYPFHPATLSVFQRKWQALPQYQQTRGTLAMLAQWVSIAAQDAFTKARTEPLITLGSAPLGESGFRSVVLGQLGESRLVAAIASDISSDQAHSKALDADTKGPLRDIHRRVATAILFESSGGQTEKVAHLPELRFAIGEPDIDTTSIDNAALALEDRAYFIRRIGSDGFRIGYQPTLKKVVSDRRASLDEEAETRPAMRKLVEDEFRRGASIPVVSFPRDGSEIPDTPRLTLIVVDPDSAWSDNEELRRQIAEWTKNRSKSPRLYPGALVWCLKKPGRDLREKIELALAWKRVAREVADGTLGGEFERSDRADLQAKAKDAEDVAKDEVWGDYRFAIVADSNEPDGLKVIDLGAGHSSSGETLCGRVLGALKSGALLNESIGAGYLDRNWPPALKADGEWSLASLRQSFLNGGLTRLVDPDIILKHKIVEFVGKGDFGLASGKTAIGKFDRLSFRELISTDEVMFESDVFLLRKGTAEALLAGGTSATIQQPSTPPADMPPNPTDPTIVAAPVVVGSARLSVNGTVPPEVWNRLGSKVLPRMRAGANLKIAVEFAADFTGDTTKTTATELRQVLQELGVGDTVRIEEV
jgi:hypothetical protein